MWRTGWIAEAIAGHGLLTGDDLAGWRATEEAPVTFDYRGYTVCKTGPWGQGPVFLQQLALLDGLELTPTTSSRAPSSASPTARRTTATPRRSRSTGC